MKHFTQYERKRGPLERRDSRRSHATYRRSTVDDLLQKSGYMSQENEDNSFMVHKIISRITRVVVVFEIVIVCRYHLNTYIIQNKKKKKQRQ